MALVRYEGALKSPKEERELFHPLKPKERSLLDPMDLGQRMVLRGLVATPEFPLHWERAIYLEPLPA